jgi:uncharacterized protein YqgC (DUF456 family)
MDAAWALLLILVLLIGLLATIFGLPGNWIMVAAAAVYAYAMPPEKTADFGWPVLLTLALLAALGELLEFVASALGVARGGGTRRGALMALVGSLVGAVVGMLLGVPIPVIGPILAALLFASLGAMVGAMIGEHSTGRPLHETWQIGKSAFLGRLFGTLAKTTVGAVMVVVVTVAVFV